MERQTCADCGNPAPETETEYTLISAKHGWRVARRKAPDGSFVIEWRCPSCWREFKRGGLPSSGGSDAPPHGSRRPR